MFIDQYKSDENGCLKFTYYHPENAACEVIVKGMTDNPPHNANIISAEVNKNSVALTWDARKGAQKYKICKYMNGLAVPIAETEELTYTVENLEYDSYYSFIVITYIGGEWSEADINNCVFVHIDESDAFEGLTDQDYIDYVNGFTNSTEDIVLNEYQLRAIE